MGYDPYIFDTKKNNERYMYIDTCNVRVDIRQHLQKII